MLVQDKIKPTPYNTVEHANMNQPKMSAENFCYWLQGYFEISDGHLDENQIKVVKEHLNLVFNKVTMCNAGGNITTVNVSETANFNHPVSC